MTTSSRAVALRNEILLAGRRNDTASLRFRIVGHIDGHYSLSGINRGLALGLAKGPGSVVINHQHGDRVATPPADLPREQRDPLEAMLQPWETTAADDADRISICHHYPLITDTRPARLRLAFFFWEESVVPASHVDHLNSNFSSVLVATEFVRKALRDSGCRLPIKVVPLGVEHVSDLAAADRTSSKARFRFLHVSSAFPRKGLDILLNVYFAEFSGNDDVELFIKTFENIHNDVHAQLERLRRFHANPPRVIVDETLRTQEELVLLYQSADVVVLPTRGEGFNLPAAEALSLGVPVITTAYGGQADFVTPDTGWCLDYDFAPSQSHLASEGSLWLEPQASGLRQIMRCFIDKDTRGQAAIEAAAKSQAGRALVLSTYRWSNAGLLIRAHAADLLLAASKLRNEPIRMALVASWATKCGVAEYSRMLFDSFDTKDFNIDHFCDSRTAAAEGTYPLFSLGSGESFVLCCEAILARQYDAIVVQHQQSIFDIFAAAPHLARLQLKAPVFLTLHGTQFLEGGKRDKIALVVRMLKTLERVIVHSLADQALLKRIDLVDNVLVVPQGLFVPDHLDQTADLMARRRELSAALDGRRNPAVHSSLDDVAPKLRFGDFWIGTFGFLLPHKGLQELVDAVRRLRDAGHTGVRMLMLCASLDERSERLVDDIQRVISEENLSESIFLIRDYLSMAEVYSFLNAMDLIAYAYTGTGESSSAAVRAGIAVGRPILTTPLPIFDEISSFALRTNGVDGQKIAEAVRPLIKDRKRLESGLDLQKSWLAQREWSRIADLLSNMLQGVVAERRLANPAKVFETIGSEPRDRDGGSQRGVPLCPPGIRQPATGRARPWLSRIYSLAPDLHDPTLDPNAAPRIPVVWDESDLVLCRTETGADSSALHLADVDRPLLSESVLLISAPAMAAVPPDQRLSLLAYARRHNMRSVLEYDDRRDTDAAYSFADVLVTAHDGSAGQIRAVIANKLGKTIAPPRVCDQADMKNGAPWKEASTLRRVVILGPALDESALVHAIRSQAPYLNGHGQDVVRFDDADGTVSDWVVISPAIDDHRAQSLFGAGAVSPSRIALLITPSSAARLATGREPKTWDLIKQSTILLFDTAAAYQQFFDVASKRDESVSLLRRRAVLIEPDPGEPAGDLVDRVARIFRQMAPLRLSEVVSALSWQETRPLPSQRKRLSVCVSTYNRAEWLRVTLPLMSEDIAFRPDIDFLVVDNTSTDQTPLVLEELSEKLGFRWVRNPRNVGMLGNLAVTASMAVGDYVWILGDDDLVLPGTIGRVLAALQSNPKTELLYLNYAYTNFDRPADLERVTDVISGATPISPASASGFFRCIRDFAANNENLFTAIYACVFRRDHAIAAYTQYTGGPPFSSLATCIPTTKYVLEHMMDRPGYWIGSHQVVVNMNVSWMKYALVWHMERLTEAFDLAESMGADPDKLLVFRKSNVGQVIHFMTSDYERHEEIRGLLSMTRYVESAKRIREFPIHSNNLLLGYDRWADIPPVGRDLLPSATIRAIYGL